MDFVGGVVLRCLRVLRRLPFTIALVAGLWLVAGVTGSVSHGPQAALSQRLAVGVESLAHGRWWTPATSAVLCSDLAGYVLTTALLVLVGALVEARLGTVRMVVAFAVSQVGGALLGVGLVAAGSVLGEWWSVSLADATAVGPSTGALGVALAMTWRCSPLWRRRVRLVVLVGLGMLVLYSGTFQDVVRLGGGLVGLAAGPVLTGSGLARRRAAPVSSPEARLLLALITAASAVGPVIAVLSGAAVGPLSPLRYVFLPSMSDLPQMQDGCSDQGWAPSCHGVPAPLVAHRFAGVIASVVPVLILLVLAEGLRRGRRFAWWATVVLSVVLAGFAAGALGLVPSIVDSWVDGTQSRGEVESLMVVLASALCPLLVVMLLVAHRRAFDVAAPPGTYRRLLWTAGTLLVALSVAYLVIGWLLRDSFRPRATLWALARDLPLRFAPPGYLQTAPSRPVPVGIAALLLHDWVAVVFWSSVLAGVWVSFRRGRAGTGASDAALARGLLVRHGGSQLSYMTTWPGNAYWFSAEGHTVVTYRLVGTIALTVGDPIGEPHRIDQAVSGFAGYCARNGWTPCFYSVTEDLSRSLAQEGWKLLQVAEDTRLPLAKLAFTGRRWQDVRTAMSRARREGIEARWHSYRDGPAEITEQIRAISAEWVLDKGVPEMGFTLGGIAELGDDAVRCLVARDTAGVVHAVTSWLPVYQASEVVGWTLDMMRRRPTAGNGLMEFLIASAALRFKEEGAQFLSLSGAPLAHHAPRPRSSGPQWLLDRIGRAIEPVYGFGSLLAFKAKFQPVYRPLMLAYPESAALPGIAVAIARAYLPALTPRQAVRLIRLILHRTGPRHTKPDGGTAGDQTPAIPPAADLPRQAVVLPAVVLPAVALPAVAPPAVALPRRPGPVLAGSGPGLPEGG